MSPTDCQGVLKELLDARLWPLGRSPLTRRGDRIAGGQGEGGRSKITLVGWESPGSDRKVSGEKGEEEEGGGLVAATK
jgi:hypothetical protein